MERPYFDSPKQVVFMDPDAGESWISGIAYRDEIICACCGGIFEIEDVCDMGESLGLTKAIYPYEDWIDIRCEICGDCPPEGLIEKDGKWVEDIVPEEEYIQMEMADVEASIGDYYTDGRSDEKIFN